MKNLENKTIIITGASRGLGRAIAKKLARYNTNVVISARNLDQLKELENQFTNIFAIKADITKEKDVQNLIQQTISKFNQIDILINNAGVYSKGTINQISLEEWNKIINTNLTGTFLCTKEVIKYMIPKSSGHIINISSVAGKKASKYNSVYCASKFGVLGFSKSITKDLKDYNIKVTTVCPSAIDTDLFGQFKPHIPKSLMLKPEKVADIIYKIIIGKKKKQVINIIKFRRILYYLFKKLF